MPASDFADLFAKPLSKIVFPKSSEFHTFIYHSNNENKARKEFLAQHKSKVIHTNKNKKQKTKITKFNTSKPLNKQVLKQVDNSVIETDDPDLKLPERKVPKQHKWPTIKPVTRTWNDNNDKNIISPVSPSVPGVDLLGVLLNSNLNSVSIGHNAETESLSQPKNDQSSFKINQIFKKQLKKPNTINNKSNTINNNKSIKEIAEKYKKKKSEKADNIGKRPSDAFNKTHVNKEPREASGSFSINNSNKPLNNDNGRSASSVKITNASIKTRTEQTAPTLISVKGSIKVNDLIGPTKEPIINIDERSSGIPKNQYLSSSPVSINNRSEEALRKIEAPKFVKESNNLTNRKSENEYVKLRINEKISNSEIFNSSEEKKQFLDFIPSNEKDKCLSLDEILLNISDEIYIERSEQEINGQQKETVGQRSDTKSFFEIQNFVKAPTGNNLETSPIKIHEELLKQSKTIEKQVDRTEDITDSQQRQVLKQKSQKNEKEVEKGNSNHKVIFKMENLLRVTNENYRKSSSIKTQIDSPRKQPMDVFDLCFASKKESHDELNLEKVVEHLTKPKTDNTPSQVRNISISQFSDEDDSDELVIDATEDDIENNEYSRTLRKIPRKVYHFRKLNSDSDEGKMKESKIDSECNKQIGNNLDEGDLEEGEIENESDINDETNAESVEAINKISEENLFGKSNKVNLMKNNQRKSTHHEKDKLEIYEPEKDPGCGIETKKNNCKLTGKSKRKRKSRDSSINNENSKNKAFRNSNQMFSYFKGTNANQDRVYTRKLRSSSASGINGKNNNTISYNARRRSDPDHSTSVTNEVDQKERTRHNQRSYVNVKPDHEQVRVILLYKISLLIFQKIFLLIIR